jgi:acetyl esterase
MIEAMWPEFRAIVEKDRASGRPGLEELSIADAREVMAAALVRWGGAGPEMGSITERAAVTSDGEIPITFYVPEGPTQPLPVLAYVHGGGFILGSVRTHDALVRALAAAGCMIVASIEYERAPESRFPGPPAQCLGAVGWIRDHARELGGDPGRVAIAGDSSGATIAATVCLLMRDQGVPPLVAQCLLYPPLTRACDTPSWGRCGTGHFLNRTTMRWFWDLYLQAGRDAALAEPLHAADLRGLPPTLLLLPGLDPLVDEGKAYAARLGESGVEVQTIHRPGAIHGYLGMGGISPRARDDLGMVGARIEALISASPAAPHPAM